MLNALKKTKENWVKWNLNFWYILQNWHQWTNVSFLRHFALLVKNFGHVYSLLFPNGCTMHINLLIGKINMFYVLIASTIFDTIFWSCNVCKNCLRYPKTRLTSNSWLNSALNDYFEYNLASIEYDQIFANNILSIFFQKINRHIKSWVILENFNSWIFPVKRRETFYTLAFMNWSFSKLVTLSVSFCHERKFERIFHKI